jgi:hypothetical protein
MGTRRGWLRRTLFVAAAILVAIMGRALSIPSLSPWYLPIVLYVWFTHPPFTLLPLSVYLTLAIKNPPLRESDPDSPPPSFSEGHTAREPFPSRWAALIAHLTGRCRKGLRSTYLTPAG